MVPTIWCFCNNVFRPTLLLLAWYDQYGTGTYKLIDLSQCHSLCRPGATGGPTGAVPPQMTACAPNENCGPHKRGQCPEEINRLGASGVQIEAQIGVFCGLTPDFMTFLDEDFFFVFFLEITCFSARKNRLNFRFRPENPLQIWRRPFFLEITVFGRKNRLNSDFGRKILLNLCFSPCFIWSRLG